MMVYRKKKRKRENIRQGKSLKGGLFRVYCLSRLQEDLPATETLKYFSKAIMEN